MLMTARYVHWQDYATSLGYLKEFPDCVIQSESLSNWKRTFAISTRRSAATRLRASAEALNCPWDEADRSDQDVDVPHGGPRSSEIGKTRSNGPSLSSIYVHNAWYDRWPTRFRDRFAEPAEAPGPGPRGPRGESPTMTSLRGWEGIEGIVLDAVGTLIDPSPSVAEAYAAAALRQGLVVDESEVKRRFGVDVAHVLALGTKVTWQEDELVKLKQVAASPVRWFDTHAEAVERFLRVAGLAGIVDSHAAVVDVGVRSESDRFRLAADPATVLVVGPEFGPVLSAARATWRLAKVRG